MYAIETDYKKDQQITGVATYTKSQLAKMTKAQVEKIVADNWIFCYGSDKQSLIEGILAAQ
jgi:hypothetical protein